MGCRVVDGGQGRGACISEVWRGLPSWLYPGHAPGTDGGGLDLLGGRCGNSTPRWAAWVVGVGTRLLGGPLCPGSPGWPVEEPSPAGKGLKSAGIGANPCPPPF